MIRLSVVSAAFVAVAFAVAVADEAPTRTGDIIGSVVMRPDHSLSMRLRSVQCDGTLAEGILEIKPAEDNYQVVIDHVGGLQPSETKPVSRMAHVTLPIKLDRYRQKLRCPASTSQSSR
jgi:hypothetical protein